MNILDIKKKANSILKHHDVKRAAIFGSTVRGEARKNSDIDILVEIKESVSLFDFVGLKLDLEEALGKKVDLVEYKTIKPPLKNLS